MMRTRHLPRTDMSLTELSFGGASIGNLYEAISDEVAAMVLEAAWSVGIRYFDTAPHYGLGLSERRIGEFMRGKERSSVILSSKVGRLLEPADPPALWDSDHFRVPGSHVRRWDFTRDGILRSVEASLMRLQTDYLDIALLHDPELSGDPKAAEMGAVVLAQLRDEGVIRATGIGSNSSRSVAELLERSDIDTAMLAGRYTLLDRSGEAVFRALGDRRLVVAGVFNSGLLSSEKPTSLSHYNYMPVTADVLIQAQTLASRASSHSLTLPQVALQFPLQREQVASVVVGMGAVDQVQQNSKLFNSRVPDSLWDVFR